MDDELRRMSMRAQQGDFDEVQRLYAIAQSSLKFGDQGKALWCLKELAFAYREQAQRARSDLERLEECSKETPRPTRTFSDFLSDWIETFPQGFANLPIQDEALKDMEILRKRLWIAEQAMPGLVDLAFQEIELMGLPMHNFRSTIRYLYCFIYVYFGAMDDREYMAWINQSVKLRILIDLLAAHIRQAGKNEGIESEK